MTAVLLGLSTTLGGLAVVLGALTLASTRHLRTALAVTLELLLAAGLLRLATAEAWSAIGAAAGLVAVRMVAATGLRSAAAVSSPAG